MQKYSFCREICRCRQICRQIRDCTDNDGYSGDRYSGNDGYSGLNPPDDAILFTVSGITAIADKKLEIKKAFCLLY